MVQNYKMTLLSKSKHNWLKLIQGVGPVRSSLNSSFWLKREAFLTVSMKFSR